MQHVLHIMHKNKVTLPLSYALKQAWPIPWEMLFTPKWGFDWDSSKIRNGLVVLATLYVPSDLLGGPETLNKEFVKRTSLLWV